MEKMEDRGAVMVSGWDEDDRQASSLRRWVVFAYPGSGKIDKQKVRFWIAVAIMLRDLAETLTIGIAKDHGLLGLNPGDRYSNVRGFARPCFCPKSGSGDSG